MVRKLITSIFVFVSLFLLSSGVEVSAKVIDAKEGNASVTQNEIINDDLFAKGQNITINGVVNGDVFAAAQSVKVNGVVNGNLHIGAQTVDLNGASIEGNIYIGAQAVTILNSKINGSVISGSQAINIDKETSIGGSILAGASDVKIDSEVKRNVMVGAETLFLGENTKIDKNLYYAVSQNEGEADISQKAVILGETHKADTKALREKAQTAQKDASTVFSKAKTGSSLISYLGALIISLILFKFFNPFITNAANKVSQSPWKSLGVGILITIGFIPAILILLISIIGIPLAGILILLLTLYGYLAKIVVGKALGNLLSTKLSLRGSFLPFAVGLLIVYILRLIPHLGGVAGAIIFWLGIGAIFASIFSKKAPKAS